MPSTEPSERIRNILGTSKNPLAEELADDGIELENINLAEEDIWSNRRHAPKFYKRLDEEPGPLRERKAPLYEVCLAFFLFTAGVLLLLLGQSVFWTVSLYESLPYTVLGSVCFIPGSYHAFIFMQIWRGEKGWSYDDIPLIDH